MFIGLARFELFIPASGSLKEKRAVLRSVTSAVRNKFNVAIAEVDYQDLWQRTAFGIACVAESADHCRRVLQEVEKAVGRAAVGYGDITDRRLRFISMDDL